MESIKVKSLTYSKVPMEEAKSVHCDYCGNVGFTFKWWKSVVRILEKLELKILFCSTDCKKKFAKDPNSQKCLDRWITVALEAYEGRKKNKVV
jgi:hypothetical protein